MPGSILTCLGTPPIAAPICIIVSIVSGVAPLKMLSRPLPSNAGRASATSASVGATYMKWRYWMLSAVGSQPLARAVSR